MTQEFRLEKYFHLSDYYYYYLKGGLNFVDFALQISLLNELHFDLLFYNQKLILNLQVRDYEKLVFVCQMGFENSILKNNN